MDKEVANVTKRNFGIANINDYWNADYNKIKPEIEKHIMKYRQYEDGFLSNVNVHILWCDIQLS